MTRDELPPARFPTQPPDPATADPETPPLAIPAIDQEIYPLARRRYGLPWVDAVEHLDYVDVLATEWLAQGRQVRIAFAMPLHGHERWASERGLDCADLGSFRAYAAELSAAGGAADYDGSMHAWGYGVLNAIWRSPLVSGMGPSGFSEALASAHRSGWLPFTGAYSRWMGESGQGHYTLVCAAARVARPLPGSVADAVGSALFYRPAPVGFPSSGCIVTSTERSVVVEGRLMSEPRHRLTDPVGALAFAAGGMVAVVRRRAGEADVRAWWIGNHVASPVPVSDLANHLRPSDKPGSEKVTFAEGWS